MRNPFKNLTKKDVEESCRRLVMYGIIKYTIEPDGEYRWYGAEHAPDHALGADDMRKQIDSERQ